MGIVGCYQVVSIKSRVKSCVAIRVGCACPVTGSLVFRGSIGPAVTLRLPFLVGMLCVRVVGVGLRCYA